MIDVPKVKNNLYFQLLMNGDLNKAMGILMPHGSVQPDEDAGHASFGISYIDHRQWRMQMAEKIASELDAERFGVKAIYILGSTKTGAAKAGSDIDLLVHFAGTPDQRKELELWFEGWSLCLDEMNYLRTGFKTGGLLDVRFITDEELANEEILAEKYNITGREGIERLLLKNDINATE